MSEVAISLVKDLRQRTGMGVMECKQALLSCDGDIEAAVRHLRESGKLSADKKSGRITAEGLVLARVSEDGSNALLLEINCETDFVARDPNLQGFADTVLSRALSDQSIEFEDLIQDKDLEAARTALIQKIGENINLRRMTRLQKEQAEADVVFGQYTHSNQSLAAVVQLQGGSVSLACEIAMHIAAFSPMAISEEDFPQDALEAERAICETQARESGKPEKIAAKMVEGRLRKFIDANALNCQGFVKDPDVTVGDVLSKAGARALRFKCYRLGEGIEKKTSSFADEVSAQLKR